MEPVIPQAALPCYALSVPAVAQEPFYLLVRATRQLGTSRTPWLVAGLGALILQREISKMDQQAIIAIAIVCLTLSGFAAYFATILFGPNMKKYWDNRD